MYSGWLGSAVPPLDVRVHVILQLRKKSVPMQRHKLLPIAFLLLLLLAASYINIKY